MLGWFRAACPVNPITRDWIETRWDWLGNQFGHDLSISNKTILPAAEFFPDQYDKTETTCRRLLERVCGYMGANSQQIQLEFFSQNRRPQLVNHQGHAIAGTAGTYRRSGALFIIRIERTQLEYPMDLVGTVAHELAHARLLGEDRLDRDSFDNEILTDLTVVFHGMGIFLANVPRHWRSSNTTWPGIDLPKPEYMTTQMHGYALAYRAWMNNHPQVKWKRYLVPGVRAEFNQAIRFLKSTQHK